MSSVEASPNLIMRTHEKFDGSVWRQYESADNIIILTGAGRQLVATEHLAPLLRNYAEEAAIDSWGTTRKFLAEGGNADVFTLGDKQLVIKERKADPVTDDISHRDRLLPALERMDDLTHAVETHCPRWIDIPRHYGILMSKKDPGREYMLMEKVDDGVTVGDILHYGETDPLVPRPPHMAKTVERTFGGVTPKLKEDIQERWEVMKGELRKALMAEYKSPDDLLPDLDNNEYNILVERLDTPIAGSPYKFWVIDQ